MLDHENLAAFKTSPVTARLGVDVTPLENETPEDLLRPTEG